jgi:hypothetical protein
VGDSVLQSGLVGCQVGGALLVATSLQLNLEHDDERRFGIRSHDLSRVKANDIGFATSSFSSILPVTCTLVH